MEQRPTDMLEEEHRFIQKVVGAMAVLVEALETGHDVERAPLQDIVEFMRTFGDKCHHGKEEMHLFPLLERKGVPVRGCPLGILIQEHQKGRELVQELATAAAAYTPGNPSVKASLIKSLRGLTELYPNHIWKEEYLAFPMTNKVLSPEEQSDLCEKFALVEETVGREVHHHFEQLAETLEKKVHGA